jgi:hypothetical protein
MWLFVPYRLELVPQCYPALQSSGQLQSLLTTDPSVAVPGEAQITASTQT